MNEGGEFLANLGWSSDDALKARLEGWRIVRTTAINPRVYIMAIARRECKKHDLPDLQHSEANDLVQRRADEGSELHERAMAVTLRAKMEDWSFMGAWCDHKWRTLNDLS